MGARAPRSGAGEITDQARRRRVDAPLVGVERVAAERGRGVDVQQGVVLVGDVAEGAHLLRWEEGEGAPGPLDAVDPLAGDVHDVLQVPGAEAGVVRRADLGDAVGARLGRSRRRLRRMSRSFTRSAARPMCSPPSSRLARSDSRLAASVRRPVNPVPATTSSSAAAVARAIPVPRSFMFRWKMT